MLNTLKNQGVNGATFPKRDNESSRNLWFLSNPIMPWLSQWNKRKLTPLFLSRYVEEGWAHLQLNLYKRTTCWTVKPILYTEHLSLVFQKTNFPRKCLLILGCGKRIRIQLNKSSGCLNEPKARWFCASYTMLSYSIFTFSISAIISSACSWRTSCGVFRSTTSKLFSEELPRRQKQNWKSYKFASALIVKIIKVSYRSLCSRVILLSPAIAY